MRFRPAFSCPCRTLPHIIGDAWHASGFQRKIDLRALHQLRVQTEKDWSMKLDPRDPPMPIREPGDEEDEDDLEDEDEDEEEE